MMKKKRRSYSASDLAKIFAKTYGFEDKLLAFEVKKLLSEYLDEQLFAEIKKVNYADGILKISIASPILKNDFHFRKSFYLNKFNEHFGEGTFTALEVE